MPAKPAPTITPSTSVRSLIVHSPRRLQRLQRLRHRAIIACVASNRSTSTCRSSANACRACFPQAARQSRAASRRMSPCSATRRPASSPATNSSCGCTRRSVIASSHSHAITPILLVAEDRLHPLESGCELAHPSALDRCDGLPHVNAPAGPPAHLVQLGIGRLVTEGTGRAAEPAPRAAREPVRDVRGGTLARAGDQLRLACRGHKPVEQRRVPLRAHDAQQRVALARSVLGELYEELRHLRVVVVGKLRHLGTQQLAQHVGVTAA